MKKEVKVIQGTLKGSLEIPPSKSLSHRAVIAAGLADGKSLVSNILYSDDLVATRECMETLGTVFAENQGNCIGDSFMIEGNNGLELRNFKPKQDESNTYSFECNESGSTIRFMIPIACTLIGNKNKASVFTGKGRLTTRPMESYFEIFEEQGIGYKYEGSLPLTVNGAIKPGTFRMRGDISSQFITGLLYTLPMLEGDSIIEITTEMESIGYIDLTLDVLKKFGVEIQHEDYKIFRIRGNQTYRANDYKVEGDYSQVAFWIVGGLLNGEIECENVLRESSQGDIEVVEIVERMGGNIEVLEDRIIVKKSDTKATVIDGSQCPDIIPVLTVLAALSEGETRVINAGRLRIKESDRLNAITTELNKLGADITELEDGLIIRGKKMLRGGIVEGWDDHRIVMSLAIASLKCTEDVIIKGSEAVTKSYPHFFEDFAKLGGNVYERDME